MSCIVCIFTPPSENRLNPFFARISSWKFYECTNLQRPKKLRVHQLIASSFRCRPSACVRRRRRRSARRRRIVPNVASVCRKAAMKVRRSRDRIDGAASNGDAATSRYSHGNRRDTASTSERAIRSRRWGK